MSDAEERSWHVRECGAEIAGTMFIRPAPGEPRCAKLVHPPHGRLCHFIGCAYRREAREHLGTADPPRGA